MYSKDYCILDKDATSLSCRHWKYNLKNQIWSLYYAGLGKRKKDAILQEFSNPDVTKTTNKVIFKCKHYQGCNITVKSDYNNQNIIDLSSNTKSII